MSQITSYPATGPLALQAGGTFQSSTDASLATLVGTRWSLSDGREVILASVGATAAVSGFLYADAATVANHQNLAVTANQVYSVNGNTPQTVTVTLGATALTANQYQGGFLIVTGGTGIGQTLRIAENPVALASATGVVITLEDGGNTALDTSSTVSLVPAHGANVIINPTTFTGALVGVALAPYASGSYGFFVSHGLTGAVSDASVAAAGKGISPSVTTAGTVTVQAATTPSIGTSIQLGVSAKAGEVFISL
jgi:hypothetical protein